MKLEQDTITALPKHGRSSKLIFFSLTVMGGRNNDKTYNAKRCKQFARDDRCKEKSS